MGFIIGSNIKHAATCSLVTASIGSCGCTCRHTRRQTGPQECVASLCCMKPQIPCSIITVCRLEVWVSCFLLNPECLKSDLWVVLVQLRDGTCSTASLAGASRVDSVIRHWNSVPYLLKPELLKSETSTACHYAHLCHWTLRTTEQAEFGNERLLL